MDTFLCFFGTPRHRLVNEWVPLPANHVAWLLVYLALQNDWVERKALAELFWDDPENGLNNLRQLLHRHKNLLGDWLEFTPKALRLKMPSDVQQFRLALQKGDWQAALTQNPAPLLAGLTPLELPNLTRWLENERQTLQDEWQQALTGRIAELEATPEVHALLVQLLELDPYNEEALQHLLKASLHFEKTQEAIRQFELFYARLRSDLGVEPHPETLSLVAKLRGQAQPEAQLRFVGRTLEQEAIRAQLEAGCRMLVLRGAGGIGKTTLALEVFAQFKTRFAQAIWVSLRDVRRVEDVPQAVAVAFGVSLQAGSNPWEQLGAAFGQRKILVALDNLEQLASIGEPLVGWLEVAPSLTLLLTSRTSLGVPHEWVLTLEGLDYPSTPDLELARLSSAVQLFVSRASRRRGGFALTDQTLAGILELCQLLQGLPLGLELAAAWMGDLSLEMLLDGLKSNADWLSSTDPNTNAAHRSLRVVFEHSWELLEDDLRQTLCAVAVFQGGFDRVAALEGMGVSARSLLGLVARSLLGMRLGRYELHPMVQQYALQKLEPSALKGLQLRHAQYFTQFAELAELPLQGGSQQLRWLGRIAVEHKNFLALCDNRAHPELVLRAVTALVRYWFIHHHTLEGYERIKKALQEAKKAPLDLRLRAELAAGIQGNFLSQYAISNAHLEKVIRQAKIPELESLRAQALNWRGANAVAQGELPQAKIYLEQAEVIQRRLEDVSGLASTLNDIGRLVYNQENTDDRVQARAYFQKSLELANQCGDKNAQSVALQNIANSYPTATPLVFSLIEQSMEISRQLGNLGGIANRLHNLGGAMLGAGNYTKAKQYLLQSLELNLRIGRRRDAAFSLGVLAQPYVLEGAFAHGLTLFAARAAAFEQLGAKHSPAQQQYENNFEQKARAALGEQLAEAAFERGRAMPLEQIVVLVRQDLEPFEPVAFEI